MRCVRNRSRGDCDAIFGATSDAGGDVVEETIDPKLAEVIDASAPDESQHDESRPKEGFVFCSACSHVIGHIQDRIEVQGAHEHTCTNPYGYVHRFGCLRDAPGCAVGGKPQAADSWFPGFRWQLASCGRCDTHMGWFFERRGEHFYGLILDRIQVG